MTEAHPWIAGAIAALILFGSLFVLLGSIGLAKLPDFFMRLHAPTKASTLGVTGLLLASSLFFTYQNQAADLHELLIIVFLWVTAPISALMLASAARCRLKVDTPQHPMNAHEAQLAASANEPRSDTDSTAP